MSNEKDQVTPGDEAVETAAPVEEPTTETATEEIPSETEDEEEAE